MTRLTLDDGAGSFDVMTYGRGKPARVILFAVGSGGDPERHSGLLTTLADAGFTVIAPHFERLTSPCPSEDDLLLRTRRLSLALDALAQSDSTVTGVGHSIGASALLALAGGQMWLGPAQRIDVIPDQRLERLVLLAPPTGFFQAPGALDSVRTPVLAWAGSQDTITPPDQAMLLERAMGDHLSTDIRVKEGAGHFSFMDRPPPHSIEPLPDRQAFLDELAQQIRQYVST
jgi:predicted dienelactone hydrolase